MRHPRRIFDLFVQLRVLNHAFQQACPRHQDVILLLFTQLVSAVGLIIGFLQIPTVIDAGDRDSRKPHFPAPRWLEWIW